MISVFGMKNVFGQFFMLRKMVEKYLVYVDALWPRYQLP